MTSIPDYHATSSVMVTFMHLIGLTMLLLSWSNPNPDVALFLHGVVEGTFYVRLTFKSVNREESRWYSP